MKPFAVQDIKKDLFHEVLNASIDWVWRATPEAVFTYLSPSVKTMTGFDSAELIGLPFSVYSPLLLTEKSIEMVIESLSNRNGGKFGNETRRFELVYKRKDGSEFIGEMCSTPVLNSRGEMIAIQGTTRDMTAHKLLINELRNSIELFSSFFHSNTDPCCMTDLSTGAIMYANDSWLNNFDCSLDDVVGCTLSNLGIFGNTSQAELADVINRVRSSSNPIQSNLKVLTKTGEEQLCSVTSFSVDIAGVERVFTSIVDNSSNERIERELLKVAKLESASLLLAGVAHELSNQLTGIITNLSLAKTAESQSASKEYLDKTEAAAAWSRDLTQQLLAFSEIARPKLEYADVGELLRKSVSLCLQGPLVTPKIDIAPDLWRVNINCEQISLVINNLVINAKQAMPNGGGIIITAQNILSESDIDLPLKPGRYIQVSVTDLGIGIPKETESKIFDAFFTSKANASGLGLPSAKSIIEMHKGHIEVTASTSFGTTLSFYLPAEKDRLTLELVS